MMTLEEAILHAEEVAEKLEKRVKPYKCESINKKLYEVNKKEWDSCLECAKEHRQLAKWLKELKVVRKSWLELTSTVVEVAENTENKDIEGFAKFLVNYLAVLEKHIMEVNADE